jgi:hypothetical protein
MIGKCSTTELHPYFGGFLNDTAFLETTSFLLIADVYLII